MKRPLWPAAIVAPTVVLAQQSIALALAPAACTASHPGWLHGTAFVSLAIAVVLTAIAVVEWRNAPPERLFAARVASGIGAISCATLVALWMPVWFLGACWP
jgi:hypothetical protein